MTMAPELSPLMSTTVNAATITINHKRGSLPSPYHGQLGGVRTACRGSAASVSSSSTPLPTPNSSSGSLNNFSAGRREKRASLLSPTCLLSLANNISSSKPSSASLGSMGQRSRTNTMVSFQEEEEPSSHHQKGGKNATFGSNSSSPKKPLTRNGKSFSFPQDKPTSALKASLSMAKLEEMRNAVIGGVGAVGKGTKQMGNAVFEGGKQVGHATKQMGSVVIGGVGATTSLVGEATKQMGNTLLSASLLSVASTNTTGSNHEKNSPKRSISTQALKGIKRIVSTGDVMNISNSRSAHSRECDPEAMLAFFQLINLNPSDPQQRQQLNEREIKRIIRKHPEVLNVQYEFPVGGRGKLTVSRYPLSALVALGASLSLIKMVIKTNPSALEASKDFGTTVMHTACSFDTDLEVLEYLYNKHPEAVEETTKLVFLPLHNACAKTNPSLEMIQFLVDVHPEALLAINKLGDTPLRTAQRNKTASNQVLSYLEEETKQISSLEEHQELWMEVSQRQSWGSAHSTRRSMCIESITPASWSKKNGSSEAFTESTFDMSASFADASCTSFSRIAEASFSKITEESASHLSSQILTAVNPLP